MSKLQHLMTHMCMVAVCLLGLIVGATTASAAVDKRAELVVDAKTGRILHYYAADAKRYPASTTKMLTVYLVFDALEKGIIRPDTKMYMTQNIRILGGRNGGVIFPQLRVGQSITVREAIYVLLTKSANDIAILLSRTLAGSEQKFAQRMTQVAHRLGMRNSHFTNPSGLPDVRQYTTAKDMAVLGFRLMRDFPTYYQYFGTKHITIKGAYLHNHNGMLNTYQGMDGFKTGFINMSGFNLVASAQRGNQRLVAVMFGGSSAASRNYRMKQIMDIGWQRLKNPAPYKSFIGINFTQFALLKPNFSPLHQIKPVQYAQKPAHPKGIVDKQLAQLGVNLPILAKQSPSVVTNKNIKISNNKMIQLDLGKPSNIPAEGIPVEEALRIEKQATQVVATVVQMPSKPTPIMNPIIPSAIQTLPIAKGTSSPIIAVALTASIPVMPSPSPADVKGATSVTAQPVKNPFQNQVASGGWNVITAHDAAKDKTVLALQNNQTNKTLVVGKEISSNTEDFIAQIIHDYDQSPSVSGKNTSLVQAEPSYQETHMKVDHPSIPVGALQVGAFSRKQTADSYMGTLKSKVSSLSQAKSFLVPVKVGDGMIYRALFSGLKPAQAETICRTIRSEGRQCIMMTAS